LQIVNSSEMQRDLLAKLPPRCPRSRDRGGFLAHPLEPVLISLPGIDPRTGPRILADFGDVSGFASGSKLAAYAGLAPVIRQSGTSIRGEIALARLPAPTFPAASRVLYAACGFCG